MSYQCVFPGCPGLHVSKHEICQVSSKQNVGHGHVFPRLDGVRARCGGPGICSECALDLSRSLSKSTASDDPHGDFDADLSRLLLIRHAHRNGSQTSREEVEFLILFMDRLWRAYTRLTADETSGWQPIETAPKDGRSLLLGYFNELGNWRTLRGEWFEQGSMDEWTGSMDEWTGEDYGNPAGWYETSVENDDPPNCWVTEPTHWQPLPQPPVKASGDQP